MPTCMLLAPSCHVSSSQFTGLALPHPFKFTSHSPRGRLTPVRAFTQQPEKPKSAEKRVKWETLDPLGVRNHLLPLKWPHEHLGLEWADLDPLGVRYVVSKPVKWPHENWRTEWLDNWVPPVPVNAEVKGKRVLTWTELAELPGGRLLWPQRKLKENEPPGGLPMRAFRMQRASADVSKKRPKLVPFVAPKPPEEDTWQSADVISDVMHTPADISTVDTPPADIRRSSRFPSPRLPPVKLPKPKPLGVPPVTAPSKNTPPKRNPYLVGNFKPVEKEQREEVKCEVVGKIPEGLMGRLVRNGPNPQYKPDEEKYHWFDGDGMIHSVHFQGTSGPPLYSSHFVRTLKWEAENKAGRPLFVGISMDPIARYLAVEVLRNLRRRNWTEADVPMWSMVKNTGNVSVVAHSGRVLAAWEAGFPYALDEKNFSTLGPYTFDQALTSPFTAHPKIDPVTSEMIFFGYSVLKRPFLQYGVVDKTGKIVHLTNIDLPEPVMIHDCGITEHYSLLLDCPLVFQPKRILEKGKPFVFDASRKTRIGVIPRFGRQEGIKWFTVDTSYLAHVMNAFEVSSKNETEIVLRGMRYSAFSALGLADLVGGSEEQVCRLHEWRLNLGTGRVSEQRLCEVCSDFPTLHPSFIRSPHNFGYSARFATQPGPGAEPPLFDGLLKHNFAQGTTETFPFGPGRFGGEFLFVPSAKSRDDVATTPLADVAEEEGWLVGHVWDEKAQTSEVWVIDCNDFTGGPIARVSLPGRVPFGFHGVFLPP